MRKRNPTKSSDPRQEIEEGIIAVQQVYSELAANPPARNCLLSTECCRFQITGRTPLLTKGEAFAAAKAVRASGRRELPKRRDGACPLLHPFTKRCMIYDGRPFGCRTHFCEQAGGPYERREVLQLIHRLEEIDENLGGEGAREITVAVAEALEKLQ